MKLECPSCGEILELNDCERKETLSGEITYYQCTWCGTIVAQTQNDTLIYGKPIDEY